MLSIYHTNTTSVSVNYEGSHDVPILTWNWRLHNLFSKKTIHIWRNDSFNKTQVLLLSLKQLFFILQHIHIPLFSSHLLLQHPLKYLFFTLQPTCMSFIFSVHIYSCSFMLYLKMNNTTSQLVMYCVCKKNSTYIRNEIKCELTGETWLLLLVRPVCCAVIQWALNVV